MIIAITGGIGSGKSVLSRILRNLGYFVYDCDDNAKQLMDNSDKIKSQLSELISPDVIIDNKIDRVSLANIVFNNPDKLNILNSIVHKSVIEDVLSKVKLYDTLFIETAILHQSKMDKIVDRIWIVEAPDEVRIKRVIKRNGLSRKQIISRINSQKSEATSINLSAVHIINDDLTPILPQIFKCLNLLGI